MNYVQKNDESTQTLDSINNTLTPLISNDIDSIMLDSSFKSSCSLNATTLNPTVLNIKTVDSSNASPTSLFFSTSSHLSILEPTATEPSTQTNITNKITRTIGNICDDEFEAMIRRKASILVKKKVEYRLKDVELGNESRAQLEQELIEDLEDTIQEKLSEHRSSKTKDEKQQWNKKLVKIILSVYQTKAFI